VHAVEVNESSGVEWEWIEEKANEGKHGMAVATSLVKLA
jgi:hypothetical protein